MRKVFVIFLIAAFLLAGCGSEGENGGEDTSTNSTGSGNDTSVQTTSEPIPEIPPAEQCTTGEEHPIAVNMAKTYQEITTYDEIMGWFCQGALFEDILNALTTEELSDVDAEVTLKMLVEGKTWSEIWLELGITEE